MAKTTHTFEFFGPTDSIVEQFTGADTIISSSPVVKVRKTVEIEDSILNDAKMEYESKHWTYVGVGDQVSNVTPFIELYRNTSFSTGSDTVLVDIPWDSEVSKNNITHSNSNNPETITIVTGGRYNIFGAVKLADTLSLTAIKVVLLVNDSIVMDVNVASSIGSETSVPVNNSFVFAPDDVIKIQVASIGGGSVDLVTGAINTYLKIVAV